MRVLAIDPGAKPGFCLTVDGAVTDCTYKSAVAEQMGWVPDELVVEDQFAAAHIYRNGKRVRVRRSTQMTLSKTAGRLLERFPADRKYEILPDAWRAILWPGAVRLTKKVVLARLTPQYGHLVANFPKTHQPDVLEAIGIAMAWARLSQAQKEPFRVE